MPVRPTREEPMSLRRSTTTLLACAGLSAAAIKRPFKDDEAPR